MESKSEAIASSTFREIDRKILKRLPIFLATDIETAVVGALIGDAVRSSVDTLLREKYT